MCAILCVSVHIQAYFKLEMKMALLNEQQKLFIYQGFQMYI